VQLQRACRNVLAGPGDASDHIVWSAADLAFEVLARCCKACSNRGGERIGLMVISL
jgi:hypothetical protein